MTQVRKPNARSVAAQQQAAAEKSNRKIRLAIGVLVGVAALVGIGIYVQGENADSAVREELLADARSALESESTERDELSRVARSLERFSVDYGSTQESDSLLARVLQRLGRTKDAVEVVRRVAEEPGADAETALLGARIFAQHASRTDDADLLRRGLAMAESAQRSGGAEAVAWTVVLAHRLGDIETFADSAQRLVSQYGDSAEADALKPCLAVLAGQLAEREGWSLSNEAEIPAAARPLKELVGTVGAQTSTEVIDDPMFPEQWVVAAQIRLLQSSDAVGEAVLRATLDDASQVLDRLPNSIEARHLAVIAGYGLWGQRLQTNADLSRLRGHLDWLLENAPKSHAQRSRWTTLRASL